MAKRKKITTKKKSTSKILSYIAWTLAIVALILSSVVTGYYFGYEAAKKEVAQLEKKEKEKRLGLLKELEKTVTVDKKQASVNKRLKEVLKKEVLKEKSSKQEVLKNAEKHYVSASHELEDVSLVNAPNIVKRKANVSSSKPRLSIIIDDVGTKSQVEAIKSLRLPLTMSFLPPSKARPHTSELASHEDNYMVHLPMEAQSFSAEEPDTLRITDSQATISSRVKSIKKLFPRVKYINNHTGSKFTADEVAMNRLIYALTKSSIYFVDSRTTAQTMAPKVLENLGMKYVARDVFLDHHMDKPYILEQIKKAIKTAKDNGSAIAIGHPHKNTLQALYESKKLLKEVELVYIHRL
ncbi:divergent polysaccharide deacetylase family protein [Sulfurimonas aquatica]|uniref:Divergent polysaccharide deacetylase family protein n=1 Tax=Sulfurimonas aquatica TaxID=2672570 RepID=A0A975B1H3_9BACT|nr:divergent polysaccharide deacetylase family protein [Sulfurimonas aquatica]QSZ42506.1 divergent polysaccharide deacetylase family protein [Sulfurimonas aquatica]